MLDISDAVIVELNVNLDNFYVWTGDIPFLYLDEKHKLALLALKQFVENNNISKEKAVN